MLEYAVILDENIKAHGTDFEVGIAMEECAELIQAISKVRRYGFVGKYKDNLLEEIADVNIVLTELVMMFDIELEEFYSVLDRKVQRIKERLEEKQCSKHISTRIQHANECWRALNKPFC